MARTHAPIASPDSRGTGQITSVMRAMQTDLATRVLRVGLVQGGQVIEERILKERRAVTIGAGEACTFVLAAALPAGFTLFEPRRGGGWTLRFTDAMTGRMALSSGIVDLAAARALAKRIEARGVTVYELALGLESRGKVVVGDATLLFQFVPLPAAPPRAQLPIAVKTTYSDEIDWGTTMIAAFSFLIHFGLIGAVYSDWMDPAVDDDVNITQVIESVKALPAPPPVEEPRVETPNEAATSAPATAREPVRDTGTSRSPGPGTAGARTPGDVKAAEIANEMAKLDLAVLTALNASGRSATDSAIGNGDVPTSLLDRAAADAAGAGPGRGASGLDLGNRGGSTITPGRRAGFGDIGDRGAQAPQTIGSAAAPRKPIGTVTTSPPIPNGCDVPNAAAIVAGMRGGFRSCYMKRGLEVDPTMKGSVRIVARIGPNGEVSSASATGASGLSADVTSCVASRVQGAQFEAPQCGGATLVIPVTFYPAAQ